MTAVGSRHAEAGDVVVTDQDGRPHSTDTEGGNVAQMCHGRNGRRAASVTVRVRLASARRNNGEA